MKKQEEEKQEEILNEEKVEETATNETAETAESTESAESAEDNSTESSLADKILEMNDKHLRLMADFENYKRNNSCEKQPVKDNCAAGHTFQQCPFCKNRHNTV